MNEQKILIKIIIAIFGTFLILSGFQVINNIDQKLDDLESSTSSIESKVDDLESQISDLESNINIIESEISELRWRRD